MQEIGIRAQRPPLQMEPAPSKTAAGLSDISDFGITVEDCLRIAPLNQAVVVAGHGGLSRRMNWVHVVDHRDMEDSLGTQELLLTSGIALGSDEVLQRDIFEIMDRKHSAGLVVSIGEYVSEIPQQMRELADIFEIPILAIPWEVNFGDITRVLLTQFVESHYRFMELSQQLNHELLDIVLHKGDLGAVCDCILNVVGVNVAICNDSFRPITTSANASGALFGEANLQTALSANFNRSGRAAANILTLDGQVVGIAAPIIISERRRGYVVMEAGLMSPGVTARLGEIAATIAALVIAHEDELLRVARRTDGQLLGILEGTLPPSVGILTEIGLKSADPVTVMIASFETGDLPRALEAIHDFLRKRVGAYAVAIQARSVVGLVQKPKGRHSEWGSRLTEHLRDLGHAPVLGISGQIATFSDIPAKHEDVKELMRLRHFLQPDDDVVNAEHATVLLRALRSLTAGADVQEICPAILKIQEHDRSLHGSLIEALACLLEVDGNVSLAARRLGIHRHTILYRLNRISEILGTELKASMRFELRLQLLAWRLAGRN